MESYRNWNPWTWEKERGEEKEKELFRQFQFHLDSDEMMKSQVARNWWGEKFMISYPKKTSDLTAE